MHVSLKHYKNHIFKMGIRLLDSNLKMKPVTGNFTGYRLTGNRLTTLLNINSR